MTGSRIRWGSLGCVLVYLALLIGTPFAIASCGWRVAESIVAPAASAAHGVVDAPPAPTSTKEADERLRDAHAQRDSLSRQLAAADAEIRQLGDERDALAREDLRRRLAWLAGIMLLGIPASVALWFMLPAGLKSWAIWGGLGCTGFAAAAYAARAILPWLELIGWALLAAGAVWGLWQLWRFKHAAIAASDHGDRLEREILGLRDWFQGDEAVLQGLIADVKHVSAKAQASGGVRRVLALIRGKDPKAPTAPALAGLAQPPAPIAQPPAPIARPAGPGGVG